MKNEHTPFLTKGYIGPELFCDRKNETQKLVRNMQNSANTVLISNRRLGKTSLILHVFNTLNQNDTTPCLYVDVFATKNLNDFINQFASAMLSAFPEKNSIGKKLFKWLKSLSPTISYDSLSGIPQVSLSISQPGQVENSLTGLFKFLEQINTPIVLAFDEFQQILTYPEKNVEALLRTHIQHLHNLRFIFSGSSKHILSEIFNDSRRPFFASTQWIELKEIDHDIYAQFILSTFTKHKRNITTDAINYILEWTYCHTFYTQSVCSHLYATGMKNITTETVKAVSIEIITEQEAVFYQYRQMLTQVQWNVLCGIAHEQKLYQPNSKAFIQTYQLGTPSNVQRAIKSLTANEMIFSEHAEQGLYYRVYNVFLLRWIRYKFFRK